MLFCQISEVFQDCSLHGEIENHKDSPSSAVANASGDSRHKRSSSKWKDDLSPTSSTVTKSSQASELISGSKLPIGEMIMSDEMDLLVEQVKMHAGGIAFSTSTLKRLLKQSVNDPDALKTQPLLITGKPVQNEELRKIETIVNDQIKAELDVYAKEVTLSDAKRINGLRAVFGEVYPDPVRVISIGKKVDDLLADPDNKVASLWNCVDAAPILAAKKNDIRAKISLLQEKVRKG
ncbi:hypothetical protein Ancab_024056 [Ancistrocladus abbreviatus]